jgi:hypothetical protein
MSLKTTQVLIYKILKNFCFYLGFFSIGAAMFLWLNGTQQYQIFVLKLYQEHAAIFIGLWSPTFFILSVVFDRLIDKLEKRNK